MIISTLHDPVITAAQLRAARAFLDWPIRELAEQSGVSRSAIARGEKANGKLHMHAQNVRAIRTAFERHGIEFIDSNGVRLRSDTRLGLGE